MLLEHWGGLLVLLQQYQAKLLLVLLGHWGCLPRLAQLRLMGSGCLGQWAGQALLC